MKLPLSSWAIKYPLVPIVIFFGLLVMGSFAFYKLPIKSMPNVNIPVINISVDVPAVSVVEIETQITTRIENAINGIPNIKHITSQITPGVSNTQIEFQLGTDIYSTLLRVRDQIAKVRPFLPKGTNEPFIQIVEADFTPIFIYAVPAKTSEELIQISHWIDTKLQNKLTRIKGIAKVLRQGGESKEILINIDPTKLHAYQITVPKLNDLLAKHIQNLPAGRINYQNNQIFIYTQGIPQTVEELRAQTLPLLNGRWVRLEELGTIVETTAPSTQIVRFNGKPAVGFAIYKNQSASEVTIAQEVKKMLASLQKNVSWQVIPVHSQERITYATYRAALWAFLEGALLSALIVFFFFRDMRATLITALVIPLSIVPTFFIMDFLGFSLNRITLLALSLVSGILVDDAIVEIENILRHKKTGKTAYQSAMVAGDEIGFAVSATTFVIIGIFIPVSFMSGIVGQYFYEFGLTISLAVFFSLLTARFIVPMLCAFYLRDVPSSQSLLQFWGFSKWQITQVYWQDSYTKLLKSALQMPQKTLLLGAGIILFTVGLAYFIPAEFIPAEDKSQTNISVELPATSRLIDTDARLFQLSQQLAGNADIKNIYTTAGTVDEETGVMGESRLGNALVQLVPPAKRTQGFKEIENALYQRLTQTIPNTRIAIFNEYGRKDLTFSLTSENTTLLMTQARELEDKLYRIAEIKNPSANIPFINQEWVVIPRPQSAKFGVTSADIAETLRLSTLGDLHANLVNFVGVDGQLIPVKMRLSADERQNHTQLEQLPIEGEFGTVPLSTVARLELQENQVNMMRLDHQRQIEFSANLNGVSLGKAMSAIDPLLDDLPSSIQVVGTHDNELLDEMLSTFSSALFQGTVLVFLILILLFQNIKHPLSALCALPLSLFGAVFALWVSGTSLSLSVVIGILMLGGIVGKNGILLVDCIIELKKSGIEQKTAIQTAALQRARPIIMTSLAMIASQIPLLFDWGGVGQSFRQPMAITLIGGLISSTLFSLIFVPTAYLWLDEIRLKARFSTQL